MIRFPRPQPLCVGDRVDFHVLSGSTSHEYIVDVFHEGDAYRARKYSPLAFERDLVRAAQMTEGVPGIRIGGALNPPVHHLRVFEQGRRVEWQGIGESVHPTPGHISAVEYAAQIAAFHIAFAVTNGDSLRIETIYPELQKQVEA